MKKYISLSIIFLSMFAASSVPVYAQTSDYWTTLGNQLKTDKSAINDFNNYTNSSDIDTTNLLERTNTLIQELDNSLTIYNHPLPSNTDGPTQNAVKTIIQGINDYDTGLKLLRDGINANDKGTITNASTEIQHGTDEIKSGTNTVNSIVAQQHQNDKNTKNLYTLGSFIFGLISIILFVFSRKKSKYPSEQQKIALYWRLFLTSLWPTAGFIITLVSFASTSSGNYTIAWGAILFGAISFIQSLYNYFRNIKPQLDVYVKAEKILIDNYEDLLKLYSTLSTENFEHTIAGKYFVNHKVANFIYERISELLNSAQTYANQSNYDPYKVLEVNPNATVAAIKAKYHELAKRYHPDLSKSNTASQFKKVTDAYTTILRSKGAAI